MDYIVYAVLGYAAISMVRAATRPEQRGDYALVRALRPRHFVANIPAMTAVILTAAGLSQLPVLSWGWFQLLGGTGNVALGQTEAVTGMAATLVPAIMVTVAALAMPALVGLEERAFRTGSETRTRKTQLVWSGVFGLVHVTAGIPIGAAIALSVAGQWFTHCYLRGVAAHQATHPSRQTRWDDDFDVVLTARRAEREAAEQAGLRSASLAHLAWNYTLIGIVAIAMVAA